MDEDSFPRIPDDLPGINITEGLSRVVGNQKLFVKLISEFTKEYGQSHNQMGKYIDNGEIDIARKMIHTIKGVAGNLGMKDLHCRAVELESAMISGENIPSRLEEYSRALETMLPGINALEGKKPSSSGESQMANIGAARELIVELRKMLQSGDFNAGAVTSKLARELGAPGNELLLKLESSVDSFQFQQALEALDELEKSIS